MKGSTLSLGIAVLAAVACAALPAGAGAATTRYASPTGSGSACSQAAPCSIQTALEGGAVANGDEAILLPGTYSPGAKLLVTRALNVHGESGSGRPVIESSAPEALEIHNSGAALEHVEVRDSHGGGVALILAGGTADGVVAVDTGGSGTACSLPPFLPLLLRDSVCLASGEGGYAVYSGFVVGSEKRVARIRNVTALAPAPHSTGISASATGVPPGSLTIEGSNTIADGTDSDANAFASSSSAIAAIALTHSNFDTRRQEQNGFVTEPGSGTNQTAPALLADPAGGDVRELPGSPTIDAGATDPFTGPLDLEGAPRVQGAAPDIGASELTPPPPPPAPPAIDTAIAKVKINHRRHRARFVFRGSGGSGAVTFRCRLDKGKFKPCRSPKLYKHLRKGRHLFRVEAIDSTGAVDPTPARRKFRI